jgi:phage gp36-like protein
MMYCTLDDLKKQVAEPVLVELTDDEGLGTINTERVGRAIEDATDLINSYAAARYQTPLNPVPGVIRKIAVDIALYNLFSRRGYDEESADKSVVDRYKAALTFLEQLAKGLVSIGVSQPPTEGGATIQSGGRIFSRDTMRGW